MPDIQINNETLNYNNIIYVDADNGDDANGDGSENNPYQTLSTSLSNVNMNNNEAIYMQEGLYDIDEIHTLLDYEDVDFIGKGTETTINLQNIGGTHDSDRHVNFYNLIITVDDSASSEAYIVGCNSDINVNCGFYNVAIDSGDKTSSYGLGFSYFSTPSISKLEFINCSFNSSSTPIFIDENSSQAVVENCTTVSNAYNSADTSITIRTSLTEVSHGNMYYVTSDDNWENAGTGENPDGSQAHIGVYGGLYAWQIINKMLILSDGMYYTYDTETGSVSELGSESNITLDKSYFDTHGLEDLTQLSSSDWQFFKDRSNNLEILQFIGTDSIPKESVNINYKNIENNLQLDLVPLGQLTTSIEGISSNGGLYEAILNQVSTNSILKTIISDDGGSTWKSHLNGQWTTIDRTNQQEVKLYGMDKAKFDNVTSDDWLSLNVDIDNPLMIDYYLEVASPDNVGEFTSVDFEEVVATMTPEVTELSYYILNTISTIDVTLAGRNLEGTISDKDDGKVQYRILLNGTQVYPTDADQFTDFANVPLNFTYQISSNQINFDVENTLVVEFQDRWEKVDSWQTTFIGTYYGLMFKDVNDEFYSDENGKILKKLNFGTLVAGETSVHKEIIVENTYGKTLKNVQLNLDESKLGSDTSVELSKTQNFTTPSKTLIYDSLFENGQSYTFYSRIVTQTSALNGGDFDIQVKAEEATESDLNNTSETKDGETTS